MSNTATRLGLACAICALLAVPARAQTIDETFRSDVHRLMEITGSGQMGSQMARLISSQLLDGLKQSRPDIPPRVLEIAKSVLDEEFTKAFEGPDGLKSRMIPIDAKHFTHDKVRGLLAFYETDLGKKAIAKMPVLFEEGAQAGRQWAEANLARVTDALSERLKAEGFPIK